MDTLVVSAVAYDCMPFMKGAPKPPGSGRKKRTEHHLEIVYWPITRLQPYERNPRKNDQAVDRMVASIKEFGFTVPVLARSSGEVVDGHLRLKAAAKLHIETLPVIVCDAWSEAQVKAFRLLVNRSVGWADWDLEALQAEFFELQEMKFDLTLTGFDTKEIDGFTLQSNPAEDDVPPVPEHPTSRTGDLWLLGGHRLLCGDSIVEADVTRLMHGKKCNLLATDPPYLVNYTGGRHPQSWSNSADVKDKNWDEYVDPSAAIGFYETFLRIGLEHMADGGVVYQWHAALMQYLVHQAWLKCGLLVHQHIVWVKTRPVLTHSHYMWQHEVAFYGWPKGRKPTRRPPANVKTVWDIDQKGESDGIHPTQKPVELMRRPIEYHTDQNGLCYEPFGGSGTTLVAAELTSRHCYAMEISPAYTDVIVTRWQNLTSKSATLEGDGRTFEAIKHERFLIQLGAQDAIKEEILA